MGFFDFFGQPTATRQSTRGKATATPNLQPAAPPEPTIFGTPTATRQSQRGKQTATPKPPEATAPAPSAPASTDQQATPKPMVTPTGPTGPSGTNAFFASVMSQIDAAVQPNPLNAYYNWTYHFRLFMAEDSDLITKTGASSLQALYSAIANMKQVTLAESGVTGFNIKEVSYVSVPAGNDYTRTDVGTKGTITITEPNGISFFDGMYAAGQALGVLNFKNTTYYLELKFIGYDENGVFVDSIDAFKTGGLWVWAIKLNGIDAKITEAGAVYTIEFVMMNTPHHQDSYDITTAPRAFKVKGATVGELYQDYVKQLNVCVVERFNGPILVFDPIQTKKIGEFLTSPAWALDKDPASFKMVSVEAEKNPKRNWEFDSQTGVYTVQVTPGYPAQEFLVDAIKHTEDGQALAMDAGNVRTQTDKTATQTNERKIRESIIWSVEPVVTISKYDTTSQQYIRNIKFFITPHYAQKAVLSQEQVKNAATVEGQQNKVQAQINNGFLRKRYDFVFTGLNTEVLDFNMSFKTNAAYTLPSGGGTQLRFDAFTTNARQGPSNEVKGVRDEYKTTVTPVPTGGTKVAATPAPPVAKRDKPPSVKGGKSPYEVNKPNTSTPPASEQTQATVSAENKPTPIDNTGGPQVNNIYVEDLLIQQSATHPEDYAVPVSFWQGHKSMENNSGMQGWTGQYSVDQGVVGTIWSQIYGTSGTTGAYTSIKPLTIRGDPYWLGQCNLHRQINLLNGDVSVKNNLLPDFVTGPQCIFLYFRYPAQVGDDFKPDMRSSRLFNGLYTINTIKHYFSDGVFKQELDCAIDPLGDLSKWNATSGTNGGAGSSSQMSQSSTVPKTGTTPAKLGFTGGKFDEKAGPLTQRIMKDFNLTQTQAAAVVGNLGYESKGLQAINEQSPTVAGSRGGFGWAQWTASRRTDFDNYAKANNLDPASDDAQYGFLSGELNGTIPNGSFRKGPETLANLRKTDNLQDATASFESDYEGAGVVNMNQRVAYSQKALDLSSQPIAVASNQ